MQPWRRTHVCLGRAMSEKPTKSRTVEISNPQAALISDTTRVHLPWTLPSPLNSHNDRSRHWALAQDCTAAPPPPPPQPGDSHSAGAARRRARLGSPDALPEAGDCAGRARLRGDISAPARAQGGVGAAAAGASAPVTRAGRGRGRGGAGSPPSAGSLSGSGAGALGTLRTDFFPQHPYLAQRWSFRTSGLTVPSRAVSAWVRGGARAVLSREARGLGLRSGEEGGLPGWKCRGGRA